MQMYRLITGNTHKIAEFEQAISALLEEGYALEGPLVTASESGATHLFQAMVIEDYFTEEDDDDDEDEDE
ncbi:MAG: hypothetical protein RLZ35_167 [Pseudomonadota bacterium]|jgi:hypothetical protein